MRLLVSMLVLANALALAWWQGWIDRWVPTGRDPDRLARQIAPERLAVVPLPALEAALAKANLRCLEVGPLDDATLQRLAAWAVGLPEVSGELAAPSFRIRFAPSVPDAERAARRAELAGLAGREPAACPGQ